MRIWSMHPKYLDSKGLTALWRESLLAKRVLEGKTIGYKNHPQLNRFLESEIPLDCINLYLAEVYREATERGYKFSKDKIDWRFKSTTLTVTRGQLKFETAHLTQKLKQRDSKRYGLFVLVTKIEPHPLFRVVKGDIEEWERLV